uniref:Protein kinase domain-containing protein n=1 Tax=Daphnia magna TaxID=35525 RepID=A0A0P6F0G7_9CRUS
MSFNTIPQSSHLTLQQLMYFDKFLFTKSEPLESRFLEEFDQIELLSKGAFGHVYGARKKMENKKYAVKCIKLGKNHEEMAEDSTREVKVLSNIRHNNIVFYYNAWCEKDPPSGEYHDDDMNDENGDYSSESDNTSFDSKRLEKAKQLYENVSVTSRSDHLALSSQRQSSSDTDSNVSFRAGTNDQTSHHDVSSSQSTESSIQPSKNYTYLYIQMELCQQQNLASWLETRDPSHLKVDQIYREILLAVNYLHSKDLVHRDLKPSNIFFDSDWSIKVGDFGLSKSIATDEGSQSAYISTEENKSNTFGSRVNHTVYVGTKPYMAPEQENSQTYNHKVDVYALAIILFELKMGPFDTNSERVNIIAQLKSFQLPHDFKCDIKLKQLLYSMLSVDPDKRPEVNDMLLEHFPKQVKQLNSHPTKSRNAPASFRAPIRHARDIFHSKLLMLFLNRGIRQGYKFHLGAKMPSLGGKFDDLIFKYRVNSSTGKNRSWRYLLAQATYNQEETFKITANQLLSRNFRQLFNLAKLFHSYLDIRKRGDDIQNCIICSNVGFDKEDLNKNGLELIAVIPSNNILTFENPPSRGHKSACYRLQITARLRQKFTADWSDIHLLAKTLLHHAQNYDMYALRPKVLERNHVALINERVIDLETKKFHMDFVNNVNLSPGALQLRQIVCKLIVNEQNLDKWNFKLGPTFGKVRKNADDFLPQMVTGEDIDGFLDKLVFAVDMPNIADLDQILTDEIGPHFKLLGPHMLQNVWELSHQKFLSSEEGLKIIEDNKQAMVLNNLNAVSMDYRDRLRQFHGKDEPEDFKHLNKEVEQFLDHTSENNNHVLRLTTTLPKSTAVKVFSALETLQDFQEEYSYLTVSSKWLEGPRKMEQWRNALEAGPYQLLIVVCKDDVQFHEIYDKLVLCEALKKKVIIICKNQESLELDNGQSNLSTTVDGWKEINDHVWPSELQCIHINVEQTNSEAFRNIFELLTKPCTTEIAVLFIQGKMNKNVSCLQKMVPKNYDIIRNQSVPSNIAEGFAAIVVHRSLVYQSILPSHMLCNPQHVAGIQLSINNSLLTLYSVYPHAKDIDLFFSEAVTTCANSVLCTIPLTRHASHRDYERTHFVSLEGDGITHGADVHVNDVERLVSKCGNTYVRFSVF